MSLTSAHKGYEYQDLYSAYIILKAFREYSDFEFLVDSKEHLQDGFDDLTIIAPHQKTKFQIRHSNEGNLSTNDFVGSGRFSLDEFAKSHINQKGSITYVLATTRDVTTNDNSFSVIASKNNLLSKNIFGANPNTFPKLNTSFIKNFVIDCKLPNISSDFEHPGELEVLLFNFLKEEIGLGVFPNESLSAEQFGESLCRLIRALRNGTIEQPVSKTTLVNLLQSSGLKIDYGHIEQQFPIVAPDKRMHFQSIQKELLDSCLSSSNVILAGLPGSGKSHEFDDLFATLDQQKDIVPVQHYCYLEPTDDLVIERINVNTMFGNLVYQLTDKFPEISEKLHRQYAADRTKIEEFAKAISEKKKRVVVMIDGLDHLERVIDQKGLTPSTTVNKFIEELLLLKLPSNCTLLISSQPNTQLEKFKERQGVKIVTLSSWTEDSIHQYLLKERIAEKILQQKKDGATFISLLVELSEGNPLYLNYLAKEVKKRLSSGNVWSIKSDLPQLNCDINRYYEYLLHTIRKEDIAIAETIALLDFSITKEQLVELFPALDKSRIISVLRQLNPVLRDSFAIGGFQIYHESFRRFVLENATEKRKISKKDLYSQIIRWLIDQNFLSSIIGYNYLFSYLRRGQQQEKISTYITIDFLSESLLNLHSIDSISKNIALAADTAAVREDWSTLARLTQINKALYTFSNEREYLLDELSETFLKIFGPKEFSKRMVFNGQRVFALETGFKYCHLLSQIGEQAPWAMYDITDLKITVDSEGKKQLFYELEAGVYYKKIFGKDITSAFEYLLKRLTKNKGISSQRRIEMLVDQIFIHHDSEKVLNTFLKWEKASKCELKVLLAVSTHAQNYSHKDQLLDLLAPHNKFLSISDLAKLIVAKFDINSLLDKKQFFDLFKQLSKSVIELSSLYGKDLESFESWYSLLKIIANIQPSLLEEVRLQIIVDGWYRAWLVYLIDLNLAENLPIATEREKNELIALEKLSHFQRPFQGTPRACDLYSIHHLTQDSFKRAIEVINTEKSTESMMPLLQKISSGTTTTLQRSPGGPLTESMLSQIYLNSFLYKKVEIKKLLKKGIIDQYKISQSYGRYYEEQASEGLKASRALMDMGDKTNAIKIFRQACIYSVGYGFRKDITLWEIIESIPSIYKQSKTFAIEAFLKTYPLPYIVTSHTDGASTKWSLSYWYKSLFDSDLELGVKFLTENIRLNHDTRDWRIEDICENLADRLVGTTNPILAANLYRSLHMDDFDGTEFQPRLDLLEDFYKQNIPAEDYIDDLSVALLSWSYTFTDKKPYLDILKKFFFLRDKYKFALPPGDERELKRKIDLSADKKNDFALKTQLKTNTAKKKIALFTSSMNSYEIREVLEKSFSDDIYESKNVSLIGDLIMKLYEKGDKDEAASLLVTYARRSYISGPLKPLEEIADKLLKNKHNDIASEAYTIGFFYSRGGHGWLVMGDKESYSMAKKSIAISKKIFHAVVAREIAQAIQSPVYFTGGNQHLIEVFCNVTGELSIAKKIWTESYEIINRRLPSIKNSSLKMPNVLNSQKARIGIENEIELLIKQREKLHT